MKITSTSQTGNDALKMLIYGESGVGKTTLAGTINEPTLVISAESGLLSLRGKSIDVIDISLDDSGKLIPVEKRLAKLFEVYSYLNTDEAKKKYKWIFIDSLTEISQCLIAQLRLEFPDRAQSLVMYGENAKKLQGLVRSFRDLPGYHVVVTALSVVDKDENNQRFTTVDLVGGFAAKLPGYFDEVFYLSIDKDGVRTLLTEKTDRVVAKDRSSKLARFEQPNLTLVANKILGKLPAETTKAEPAAKATK